MSLKEVKIEKSKALKAILNNRELHLEEFEIASKGYRKKLEVFYKKGLDLVLSEEKIDLDDMPRYVPSAPSHHLKEYDRYIKMLEFEISDEIVLSVQEFEQLIMDNWGWKSSWNDTLKFCSDVDDLRPNSKD